MGFICVASYTCIILPFVNPLKWSIDYLIGFKHGSNG